MRLQSAQEDAERVEREVLNLKMEVAHLRERLRARVGGDTTAVELEAENATLRAQVADAEQAAAAREVERRALQEAHQKATLNLLKLDRAWKASADELRAAREREEQALEAQAAAREALEQDVDNLKRCVQTLRGELGTASGELQAATEREQRLSGELAALEATLAREQREKETLQSEAEAYRQTAKDTELALEETSRQVAELQQQSASGQMENEALKRQAKEAARALEETSERLAALQETADALQIESEAAKQAVREAETELLRVREETEPLAKRAMSAEAIAEQLARDNGALKSEAARLKTLLQERESAVTLQQQTIDKLERDVEEQARLVRVTAEHRGEREVAFAKEMAQVKQREWEEREREWKLQVRRAQQDAAKASGELSVLRRGRASMQQLLEDDTQLGNSSESDDPLVLAVRERLARQRETEEALATAKRDMHKNEDKLTAHTKLLLENEFLRAQIDKTKKVMERVRAMRRASNSPSARALGGSASSTPASETKSTASTASAKSTTNRRFSSEGLPIGLGGVRSAERRKITIRGKENGKAASAATKTHSAATASAAEPTSVTSAALASLPSLTVAVAPRAKRKLADMSPSLASPSWSLPPFLSAAAPPVAIAAASKSRAPLSRSDSAPIGYKRPASASSASTTPMQSSARAAVGDEPATSRSGGSRDKATGARAKRMFASQYVNVGSRLGR